MSIADDTFILLGNTLDSIKNHQHNVTAVNRTQRTHNAVFFNRFVNLSLAAHACGINEQVLLAVAYYRSINRITGSACNITYDRTLLAYQCVENRGLAHVRTADQSNLDFVLLLQVACHLIGRELGNNGIQQIAQSQMVGCRNSNRITDTQIIEFKGIHLLLRRIRLIDSQNNRLLGLTQQTGNVSILCSNACARIADEQNNVRLLNRNLCLLTDRNSNSIGIHDFDTASINHHKLVVQPFGGSIQTVAGNARCILNNGNPAVGKNIKKSRFAYIRTSNYSNYRFSHNQISFIIINFLKCVYHRNVKFFVYLISFRLATLGIFPKGQARRIAEHQHEQLTYRVRNSNFSK